MRVVGPEASLGPGCIDQGSSGIALGFNEKSSFQYELRIEIGRLDQSIQTLEAAATDRMVQCIGSIAVAVNLRNAMLGQSFSIAGFAHID